MTQRAEAPLTVRGSMGQEVINIGWQPGQVRQVSRRPTHRISGRPAVAVRRGRSRYPDHDFGRGAPSPSCEDGRSRATQETYKLVAGKLRAKLGGVRIVEANPARIDAVLRAMTNTHGPGM